ncbi:MAG TPA: carboxypeptidase-like regulatory domain-containing protein [Candidatus Acidoferrales bacterium]|nr:carboxypeptidase-like regulatory domain-containing protein [Candidatus Acidoferrales bacterium]
MTHARVFGAVLILACAGCGTPAVPPALQYATVSGQVFDSATNAGIPSAIVTVNGVQSATSDGDGFFKIVNVPNGPVDWSASAGVLYNQQGGSITLTPGQTYTLNIPLTHV